MDFKDSKKSTNKYLSFSNVCYVLAGMMDTKNLKMLNDLSDANDKSVLLVRVVRKWINHILDRPLAIISMDLILEDKEGNRVHASILKKFISCFDKKINEYNCYEISKASFASYSNNFNFHAFNFTTIDDLLCGKIPANKCIDVIGIIKDDVFVQDITKKSGKPAKKLPIDLHGSNGSKIGMTLWDSYAVNVRSYIENNPKEAPVVVILQFATYKPYNGAPGISNALGITKLIINEELPEIVEFKKRLLQMIGSETSSSSFLSPLSIRDPYVEEFVNDTDFGNVGEVEDIETVTFSYVFIC
ncbi:uncharacterized protein LOC143534011 [Bidens hawaiensis]|uniref:uncharacterized protein LOC143534011 n=1 Tax=Bidens hawaiensis TaxID=980011 RepID=UPI004049550A